MSIDKFFDLIYGDSEGWVAIVTRDEEGQLTHHQWVEYPANREKMLKYVNRRSDEDIYNTVNLFSDKRRTKHDSNAVSRVVYADADTCDPSNFRIPPSIIVLTSPDRYHCYWVLENEVPAEQAALLSQRIAKAHKHQGCDAGWQTGKLLRVPDTMNLKYDEPFQVTAHYFEDNIYNSDTFESVYSDIEVVPDIVLNDELPPPITDERRYELELELENNGLGGLYFNRPAEGQRWFELLYRLELEMFRLGFTPGEVFHLANTAACNKYERDNRPVTDLWKDVQKAQAEFESDEAVGAPERDKVADLTPDFLSLDERRYVLENPTFVQEYVDWVAAKTDSAEVYQRSLAYMTLSQVFGCRGQIVLDYGPQQLNLWVLVLGDTTLTRKSTAKSLCLQMVRGFEERMALEKTIVIGSDTSSEGLLKVLGEERRDNRAALIHTDEVNGFFIETLTKAYRAGTLERFTELYDGKVPQVIRSGQPTTKKYNDVSFSFIGVGIREKTGQVLTKENFESGFLARMLWAVADPPPYDPAGDVYNFHSEKQRAGYDPERDRLVGKLYRAARKFDYSKDRVIGWDNEAQRRFNQWAVNVNRLVYRMPDRDVLFASASRLKVSIAKAAALLAMYDQRNRVNIGDVLHALSQAELWFRDMVRMSREVSSSDYESKLDEIESFIASGTNQTRTETSVRKHFARYRPGEFDEMLKSLMKQGRVRTNPSDRKMLEYVD